MSEKILTKADILAADDLKKERLSVPEWGGDVYIRVMSGLERDAYEEWAIKSQSSLKGIRGRIAALCLVDENGNRLFTDADVDDLSKKSAAALERIVGAVMKLNAVSQKDIEEIAGN